MISFIKIPENENTFIVAEYRLMFAYWGMLRGAKERLPRDTRKQLREVDIFINSIGAKA